MSKYERKAQSQRKHGPLSISAASKAPVVAPSIGRPGWKGPGYVKKQPPRQAPATLNSTSTVQEQLLPVELQQLVLDIFRDTFPESKDFEQLKPTLQEVKDALFQRDFETAFGSEKYLQGYAVRWSPSRTLGYANLLAWIWAEKAKNEELMKRLIRHTVVAPTVESRTEHTLRVVCFGGGAAELMAFASLLRYLCSDVADKSSPADFKEVPREPLSSLSISDFSSTHMSALVDLHLVDAADWSSVVSKLYSGLTTPPVLSKYASATARTSNAAFLPPQNIKSSFTRADVLEASTEYLRSMIGPSPTLITLLFTLNELYSTSISKTTAFLLKLTMMVPRDTLLLVVDSPGSYSETPLGNAKEGQTEGEKKKYPMQWLMDHVLLEKHVKKVEGVEVTPKWEKLVDEESRWYRLDEGLKYPVSLENMRFQVHLFKRL